MFSVCSAWARTGWSNDTDASVASNQPVAPLPQPSHVDRERLVGAHALPPQDRVRAKKSSMIRQPSVAACWR